MRTNEYSKDIDKLNSFLKDELSAVETYQQCIDKVDDPVLTTSLTNIQQSHQARVDLLGRKIQDLGGEPDYSSGIWGGFAKMFEGGAKLFGDKAAIDALERGEDKGRDNYQDDVDKLTPEVRSFIDTTILPEQLRSHEMLNRVQDLVH